MTTPVVPRVTLLKLGGSLITDKVRPDSVRTEVLERLAEEIGSATARSGRGGEPLLILGHGSGSFGHAAAARWRVHEGLGTGGDRRERLPGVSATQERAAALHRLVLDALSAAGLHPFSVAPSSALVVAAGRPASLAAEPVALALEAGLLPVVYGDVVMDRDRGCAICSTERVFLALAEALPAHGIGVERALWAGATAGVLNLGGALIARIDPAGSPASADEALEACGGAAGTDVTGGMLHRLEAALELARGGTPSLVFDGRVPGRVAAALRGGRVPGTRIVAP